MRHRPLATLTAVAVLATGCGLQDPPSVGTVEEVDAAISTLTADGFESELTLEAVIDRAEIVQLAMTDSEFRDVLLQEFEGDDAADAAAGAAAEVAELQAELERWVTRVLVGADGSVGAVTELDGAPLLDYRVGGERHPDDGEVMQPRELTVQAALDLDLLGELLDRQLYDDGVGVARGIVETEQLDPLLEVVPSLEALVPLLQAFLAGELVGVTGTFDPRAFAGVYEPVTGGRDDVTQQLEEQHEELFEDISDAFDPDTFQDAVSYDTYRVEDDETVVDVSIALREYATATAEKLADAMVDAARASAPEDGADQAAADARAELSGQLERLEDLPETLEDAAQLRFDDEGALHQVRIDVVGIASQIGATLDPDDEEMERAAIAFGRLRSTGLFAVADVTRDQLDTALGEAAEEVTWDQVLDVVNEAFTSFTSGLGLAPPA